MIRHLVLVAYIALATPAFGQEAATASGARPWQDAQALLKATEADLQKNGFKGIAAHASELERALQNAVPLFPSIVSDNGDVTVLTDGTAETLLALVSATTDKGQTSHGKTVAVANPYPMLSFYLGSLYNEAGKSEDAVRVLDLGLTLSPYPAEKLGVHVPTIISERGAAFNALKRFPEALADYESGLAIKGLLPAIAGRMHRGRGFALTEMGRLDDAVAAYREALKLDPNDTRSQHELLYIAGLRAGKVATPGVLATKPPATPQADPPSPTTPPVQPSNPITFRQWRGSAGAAPQFLSLKSEREWRRKSTRAIQLERGRRLV